MVHSSRKNCMISCGDATVDDRDVTKPIFSEVGFFELLGYSVF